MVLTLSDVQNVRAEGMGAAIAATAQNVAAAYLGTAPASNERLIAEDILAAWIREAAQEVRETLSRQLCGCRHLPRRLAMKIAEDVEPVAAPVLLSSEVFTDDDLCALVTGGSAYHQITLAQRNFVPHAVSEALIETEREDVVTTLVNNTGAKLSEPALHRVIDCFPQTQPIHSGLVERAVLPVSVGYRLLTVVGEVLQGSLIERFELPKTLTGLSRDGAGGARQLANHLNDIHRLTPTFLLRALCDKRIDVFEAGLACLAHLPLEDVQEKLRMDDMAAQIELFSRAGIPQPLTLAFRAGVDTIINRTPELCDTENSEAQIIAVVAEMAKFQEDTDRAGVAAVLTRLNRKIEDAAREKANETTLRALDTGKPGTATRALARTLRPRSARRENIVPLRPATRPAMPRVAVAAGNRIAMGKFR